MQDPPRGLKLLLPLGEQGQSWSRLANEQEPGCEPRRPPTTQWPRDEIGTSFSGRNVVQLQTTLACLRVGESGSGKASVCRKRLTHRHEGGTAEERLGRSIAGCVCCWRPALGGETTGYASRAVCPTGKVGSFVRSVVPPAERLAGGGDLD